MNVQLTAPQFQKKLLDWFDQYGRKSLPWQQNKTPYRVWISEIMLQQTKVSTVIPYFERFMKQFPDLKSLSNATQDEVLHLWAGLGYYSRARNLHHASKIMMEKHHGQIPDTFTELKNLPGIGQSTAGAILSIAFQKPATILDGNVKRVLARLFGITEPINEKKIENQLWTLAHQYTPENRIADYTQAMMDLGATLCVPKNPDCAHCPFMKCCVATLNHLTEFLPNKKAASPLPIRKTTFLIFKKNKEILLYKRPAKGIWGGLFSLPEIEGSPTKRTISVFCKKHFKTTFHSYQTLPSFRHTFTHYHLDIFPVMFEVKKNIKHLIVYHADQIWYHSQNPTAVGLPKPVQTLLRQLYLRKF